ncbi:MAG TPA: hypothetical protein VFU14_06675 [Acidimicrobiales bacterium]|nr:hypothetical protein [Acidimicrobiales bacterium]
MVADRRQPPVVLVVGDDHGTVEVLRRLLVRHGLRACTAAGAAGGLEVAAVQLPRVVVVDLARTGLGSALQLVDWLRSHDDERVSSTRVLAIEAASNRELLLSSGADAALERPVHATELLAAVDEQLRTPA